MHQTPVVFVCISEKVLVQCTRIQLLNKIQYYWKKKLGDIFYVFFCCFGNDCLKEVNYNYRLEVSIS